MLTLETIALAARLKPQQIIQCLEPYVSERRQGRINDVLNHRIHNVQIAVERPALIHNASAIVRSAESLGIHQFHVIEPQGEVSSKRITQGAYHWVNLHAHEDFQVFREQTQGYTLAGASMEGQSRLETLPLDKPLCLLLGNESHGLSSEARKQCDYLYGIPMLGMSESLNLSVTAAISMYVLLQRYRQQLGQTNDLTSEVRADLQAAYYLRSVSPRLAKHLLKSLASTG